MTSKCLTQTIKFRYKKKNKKYYTIGVVPKPNQNIIETIKIGTFMSPSHKIYYVLKYMYLFSSI
jgi:hypothetical protein